MNIGELLVSLTNLISKSIIPLFFAVAVVMLVWGIVNFFIISVGDETKRTEGKQFMMWGIIALVVIISVWTLVNILGRTFSIDTRILPGVSPNRDPLKPNTGNIPNNSTDVDDPDINNTPNIDVPTGVDSPLEFPCLPGQCDIKGSDTNS